MIIWKTAEGSHSSILRTKWMLWYLKWKAEEVNIKETLTDNQAGFRKGCGRVDNFYYVNLCHPKWNCKEDKKDVCLIRGPTSCLILWIENKDWNTSNVWHKPEPDTQNCWDVLWKNAVR